MGRRAKTEELRELMRLARMLRRSATSAADIHDANLFLRTAMALEERASQLAFGDSTAKPAGEPLPALHPPVDLLC